MREVPDADSLITNREPYDQEVLQFSMLTWSSPHDTIYDMVCKYSD
jgi:hypothetical protein